MHNFVQAKQEINAIFGHLTKYLEDCDKFLADYTAAEQKVLLSDEADPNNAIITINAGAGGTE